MKVLVKEILPSYKPLQSLINPEQELNTFEVLTLLDQQEYRFKLAVEIDSIDEKELQVIRTEQNFNDIFKYDLRIHSNICRLVSSYYNHQPIQLPVDLGEIDIELPVSVKF